MKIRILSFSAALLLAGAVAQAQTAQIRGGVNLANVSVTPNGNVNEANRLTSFQVGVLADVPLGGSTVFLQPGLLLTGKGSEVEHGTPGQAGYYKQTFNPLYVELPVNLLAKAPLGKTSRFFVGAGPYIAMGVGGKAKTEGTNILGSYEHEHSIVFSNDDPTTFDEEEGTGLGVVKRFDYGLNGTAGIEGKSMVLGVNYGLGLAKLQSGSDSGQDNDNKHRVLSITLGFKL
ncbi:MAG: outer membrane beta-barrel protein [Flavisolibacter sp.]